MARTVLLILGAMRGKSGRARPLGVGFAVASLWFAACSLNPQPLPPGAGADNTPGVAQDASTAPANDDSGSTTTSSSSGGSGSSSGSSSGGGSASSSGSSSGFGASDGSASDAQATPDASLPDGAEEDSSCLNCNPVDAPSDAPADGTTD